MKVARNILANFTGTAWNGLLTLFVTPTYITLVGLEGYGLIGFWIFLQITLSILDFGLGAALVREFAIGSSGSSGSTNRMTLLRTLEFLYWGMALAVMLIIALAADWMSVSWLRLGTVVPHEAAEALQWMAIALGLQFPCGLYANGLAGLQRQVAQNVITVIAATGRHGGGVLVLAWTDNLAYFFLFQGSNLLLQTAATRMVLYHALHDQAGAAPRFSLRALKQVWRFSFGMGVTMVAGVALANIDRLFVSALLPAIDMGKYTLAATAAAMTQLGIQPFYRAYFPRWSELHSRGQKDELRQDYYRGCRFVATLLIPVSIAGICFAPEIFLAWVGMTDNSVVITFRWLIVGMSAAGLMWMPAAFQQAQGWSRLHAWMLIGALGVGIAALPRAISWWGMPGATIVWVLHGISDLTLGLWLMHRFFYKGELYLWYRHVLGPPLVISLLILGAAYWFMPIGLGRWMMAAWVGGTTTLSLGLALAYDRLNGAKVVCSVYPKSQ